MAGRGTRTVRRRQERLTRRMVSGADFWSAAIASPLLNRDHHVPDWPHAPVHRLDASGAYMVTCGTYLKRRLLSDPGRLALVQDALFCAADRQGWQLQAWAILANHYHFVALSPDDPQSLPQFIRSVHRHTARELNRRDGTPRRRVWYQYWDSHITYERSYLARLNYVHNNAAYHGVVESARMYRWCSAAWFEREASVAFRKTVASFKTDRLKVPDDF